MRFNYAFALSATVLAGVLSLPSAAAAQDRLPALIRSNSVLAGQVMGCAVRLEIYHEETVRRAAASGRALPQNYQVNLIAGLNVGALKVDAGEALSTLAEGQFPMEEVLLMVAELAVAEYDATSAGTPGYSEAWGQAAACGVIFHQFDLYELYR